MSWGVTVRQLWSSFAPAVTTLENTPLHRWTKWSVAVCSLTRCEPNHIHVTSACGMSSLAGEKRPKVPVPMRRDRAVSMDGTRNSKGAEICHT